MNKFAITGSNALTKFDAMTLTRRPAGADLPPQPSPKGRKNISPSTDG
jgi:hypothetical protein